jgi:hypothetical protein
LVVICAHLNFCFSEIILDSNPKSLAYGRHPVPKEGRIAIVTERWSGMRWTLLRRRALWRADERRG